MKTHVLILFFLAWLVPLACAALPTSSFMNGSAFYGDDPDYEGHLKGRVDYAVYDRDNRSIADEIDFVDALGLAGRYIYAYQIWNDYYVSEASVASFEVMYQDGSAVGASILNDTGSHDDGEGGIAPSTITSQGMWEWSLENGFLAAGEHSYFLIFSSDASPISGKFEIKDPEGQWPVPNPEPATVALLGLGGMVLLGRGKRRV